MRRAGLWMGLALCAALGASGAAPAATTGGSYATTLHGAYLGGGVFAGTVSTPGRGKLNGKPIKRMCRSRRSIESSTHDSTYHVAFKTSPMGQWQFWMPEEPGRRIKIFVLAKQLPQGRSCGFAKLQITEPELPPAP